MSALKGRAIGDFLKRRPPEIAAVLVYGPDAGLVRERAEALARAVVADLKDPFNAIELSDADLKGEPARLADEAAALSFMGGERVIRLRTAGEAGTAAAKRLLEALDSGALQPNALVVIEAGDLGRTSPLRKAFEQAKRAAALPCYADGPAELRALAIDMARTEDLAFDGEALDLLLALLGEDRGVTRGEIDKLLLYKGPKALRGDDPKSLRDNDRKALRAGPATITLDDVRAVLVDSTGDALDDAAAAAADGAPGALARALRRSAAAGASPISLLRALVRTFSRLNAARALVASGESPARAMEKLRPPVFFAEKRAFEARLARWSPQALDAALDMLIEAELDAKTTGAPQREIAERCALRLAAMAGR